MAVTRHGKVAKRRKPLTDLPPDVLELVLRKLDVDSLNDVAATNKELRQAANGVIKRRVAATPPTVMRGVERLVAAHVAREAKKFTGFRAHPAFEVVAGESARITGLGPQMLVSDRTTADGEVLRWRLEVRGNTACEFGVVPDGVSYAPKALHKCAADASGARAAGVSSGHTVGSMLPIKVPVMQGTVVEMVADSAGVTVSIHNPVDGAVKSWHNGAIALRPYEGPTDMSFRIEYSKDVPMRLALTSWAMGAFVIAAT